MLIALVLAAAALGLSLSRRPEARRQTVPVVVRVRRR